MVFEHRNYLPSMMFFIPISLGLSLLMDYFRQKKGMKFLILGSTVFVLIGFAHSTFMRNFAWKNELSLWIDAVEKSPSLFRTHHNLARYYQDHGFPNKALLEYEKALGCKSVMRKNSKIVGYYNMGKLYEKLGDVNKALSYYKKALEISPHFPPLLVNIAAIYDKQGKSEESIKLLKRAYQIDPSNPVTNYNIAIYYLKKQQPDKALFHLEPAVKSRELRHQATVLKAIALKEEGILGRASILFTQALTNNPKDLWALLHLLEVYARLSRDTLAKKTAEKVLYLLLSSNNKSELPKVLKRIKAGEIRKGLDPDFQIVRPLLFQVIREKKTFLDNWQQQLSISK